MRGGERQLVDWLRQRCGDPAGAVRLSVGDDMAEIDPEGRLLITTDMLLDGVHFRADEHDLGWIGYKAAACSLSDCAAMAVQPLVALVSLALPRRFGLLEAQTLLETIATTCETHECRLVGGDTNRWTHPLAIDVCMLARPWPGVAPIRRDGGRAGDGVFVTGSLGGSLEAKHLRFQPRVQEARFIATHLGERLHAMIDITDGLAIDLDRVAEASQLGAQLDEALLDAVTSDDARTAGEADGRSPLHHVLHDGEDFELLLAADIDDNIAAELNLARVGALTAEPGLSLRSANGRVAPLTPQGYEHL